MLVFTGTRTQLSVAKKMLGFGRCIQRRQCENAACRGELTDTHQVGGCAQDAVCRVNRVTSGRKRQFRRPTRMAGDQQLPQQEMQRIGIAGLALQDAFKADARSIRLPGIDVVPGTFHGSVACHRTKCL